MYQLVTTEHNGKGNTVRKCQNQEYPHLDNCSLLNTETTVDVVSSLGWTTEHLLINSRCGAEVSSYQKRSHLLRGATSLLQCVRKVAVHSDYVTYLSVSKLPLMCAFVSLYSVVKQRLQCNTGKVFV
jgi:hypothetical protein